MKKIKIIIPFIGRNEKLKFCLILREKFKKSKFISIVIRNYIYYKFHCDISINAVIPNDIYLPHPIGIVIGDGVIIGKKVTIYQNVTIGRRNYISKEYPVIEGGVIIYSGAVIAGNIKVSEGTVIGANNRVFKDTKRGEIVK